MGDTKSILQQSPIIIIDCHLHRPIVVCIGRMSARLTETGDQSRSTDITVSFIKRGYDMGKSVFTCFQILKPTMNKWAQCPVQIEA